MNLRKIVSLAAAVSVAVSVFSFMPEGIVLAAGGDVAINSTNFPDAVFRDYVKEEFDTDHNNILSLAERNAVTTIDVHNKGIADLTGVRGFSNLRHLNCSNNVLGTLDLTGLSKLNTLECRCCQLTGLNAAGCSALQTLDCSYNLLHQGKNYFNVGNSINLVDVNISYNNFTSLDWGDKRTRLRFFNCSCNPEMTSVNITGLSALHYFFCSQTALTSIDLSGNPELIHLNCSQMTALDSLDISGMENLVVVSCAFSDMDSINVTDCPSLCELNLAGNNLSSLDLTGDVNMRKLTIRDNNLSGVLSLAGCPGLVYLSCYGNNYSAIDLRGASTLITSYETVEPDELSTGDIENEELCLSYYRELDSTEAVTYPNGWSISVSRLEIDVDVPVITTDEEYNVLFPSQDPSGNGSSNNGGSSGNNGSSGNSGSGSSGNSGSSNSSTPSASSEAGATFGRIAGGT